LIGLKTKERILFITQPFRIFPEEPLYILNNNNFQFELILKQSSPFNQDITNIAKYELQSSDKSNFSVDNFNKKDNFISNSFLKFVEYRNQKFYTWDVSNKDCGEVIGYGFFTAHKKNCHTKILAIDDRIDSFNKEENNIYVVEPTSLEVGLYRLNDRDFTVLNNDNKYNIPEKLFELNIKEQKLLEFDKILTSTNSYRFNNDWKLIAGNYYIIKNFFMYERHPIFFNSDELKFKINLENLKDIIEIKCFRNNQICLLQPTIETNQNIIAEKLLESKIPYSNSNINEISEYTVSKKVNIYKKLKINNFEQKKFYLPYLGYKNFTNPKNELETVLLEQELRLIVTGGSLKYTYHSSDRSIVEIRKGILYGKNIGTVKVIVSDDYIENNYDSIEIEVKEIVNINYYQELQENLIEKPFFVGPVAEFETDLDQKIQKLPIIFTNCTNLNIEPNLSFKKRNIQRLNFGDILKEGVYVKHYRDNFNLDLTNFNNQLSLNENFIKKIFLKNNKKMSNLKLATLNLSRKSNDFKELAYINYLEFSNFGVCKLFAYKSDIEGFIEMGFQTQIENQEGKIKKIYSNLVSKIFIYKPLILSSPLISDFYTKELYKWSTFDFSNNNIKIPATFILAPGSSANIELNGGVDKWSEYNIEYQENLHAVDKITNITASIDFFKEKLNINGLNKNYQIKCLKSSKNLDKDNKDLEIIFTFQNKPDIRLINPAKISKSIIIGCQEPKYVSLFFLSLSFSNYDFDLKLKDNFEVDNYGNKTNIETIVSNLVNSGDINNLFTIPQKNNIRYFQQKGSFDGVRIYSFDEYKRMIYNFTSFKGDLQFKKIDEYSNRSKEVSNLMKIYSEIDLYNLLDNFKNNVGENNVNKKSENLKDIFLSINDLEKLIKLEKYSQNKEFIYSSIYFFNSIQNLELTYKLSNNIYQNTIIEVIDIPTIIPNNYTMYQMENNTIYLDIINGSGEFEFSVNQHFLAEYEYSRIDRKLKVIAKKSGLFIISIKDLKIGIEHKSHALIYISPIKKIELIGGGLLMVNEITQIEMKVFNIYDHVFPVEEVKKMKLLLDKSMLKTNGILIKTGEKDYLKDLESQNTKHKRLDSLFELEVAFNTNLENNSIISKFLYVRGIIPDIYTFYVKKNYSTENQLEILSEVFESENIIRSNYIKLEIFKKLEIYPSSLLMVPGSEYTLSLKGGPSNEKMIVKNFQIIDTNIALVGINEPQIKALRIGETSLKILISIKEERDYSHKENQLNHGGIKKEIILVSQIVKIKVDFPDSVEIIGAKNRKIYTKSTIRLFAALKLKGETFTYSHGPIKFNWIVDNSLIANLKYYNKNSCESFNESIESVNGVITCTIKNYETPQTYKNYNSIGTFLKTKKQGITEIKLQVEIFYPAPYINRKPNIFIQTEKILIDDNIFVDIAEFYDKDPNKSGLYLVPFNVDHNLVTNKGQNELKYSLVSQHCKSSDALIRLKDNGQITTYDRSGLAYVLIEKKEIDNKPFMPLVLPIYVVQFSSLFVDRSYQTINTEIGQSITLKILLQHEFGLLFAESTYNLNFNFNII